MLRLWPKTITAGLFSERTWLRLGHGKLLAAGGDDMPHVLDDLLAQHAAVIGRGAKIDLTVSDTVARIVSLPWQSTLSGPAELLAYAHICFEQIGRPLDAGWAMHGYFRHHRAAGLAYALPVAWLEQLNAVVGKHGLRLNSVLPVSAAAFSLHRRPGAGKPTAVILRETGRTTALVHGAAGLSDYLIEPATRSNPESAMRLLHRLHAMHGITSICDWSPCDASQVDLAKSIGQALPEIAYRLLEVDAWN